MALESEFRKAKSSRVIYKGKEIWLHHQFPVTDGQRVRMAIESFDDGWPGPEEKKLREGIGLLVDKRIELAGHSCRLLTIWPYSPPVQELQLPAEELHRTEFGNVHAEAGISGRLCLWLDKPFLPVEIFCRTQGGYIQVWNVWNIGHWRRGVDGRHNGAGMILEETENGFRYCCNDLYPDEDFDDIVFRVERL